MRSRTLLELVGTGSKSISGPLLALVDRWSFAGAVILSAFYFLTSLYISCHRMFWFDEIYTTLTIRMADWRAIWQALVGDVVEQTPVGYFLVVRAFDQLIGPSELGIRLPSTLAMVAGMWFTYDTVRRLTNRLHGLIGMAVLTCSFLPFYGYEGRSYALYFMFASVAMWAWVDRRSPMVIAAVFFCGVMTHYYMVLCLVPFIIEEMCQCRPWRRPSNRILGAVAGTIIGLTILFPQILAAHHVWVDDFWSLPVGRQVPSIYTNFFPAGLFLLAMSTLWAILNDRFEKVVQPASDAERTGWFAVVIPIAGYVLAKLITHAYVDRYMIGMLPGVTVGISCLIWRRFPNAPRVSIGVLLLLTAFGAFTQTISARHPTEIESYGPYQQRTKAILEMEEHLWSQGIRYIVIDGYDHLFITARYYSKHPERYTWWVRLNRRPRTFPHYPIKYWTLDDVKQHSREAAFVDLEPEKLEVLQESGIRTTVHKYHWLSVTYPE